MFYTHAHVHTCILVRQGSWISEFPPSSPWPPGDSPESGFLCAALRGSREAPGAREGGGKSTGGRGPAEPGIRLLPVQYQCTARQAGEALRVKPTRFRVPQPTRGSLCHPTAVRQTRSCVINKNIRGFALFSVGVRPELCTPEPPRRGGLARSVRPAAASHRKSQAPGEMCVFWKGPATALSLQF